MSTCPTVNIFKKMSENNSFDAVDATSTGQGVMPERRKAMEDLSKEQLLAMFQKFRTQAGQLATEKKTALEMLEACNKEKEEVKAKALAILRRVKELEEKLQDYDTVKKTLSELENKSVFCKLRSRNCRFLFLHILNRVPLLHHATNVKK